MLNKSLTQLFTNYILEVDGSPELDEKEADFYKSFIGIL